MYGYDQSGYPGQQPYGTQPPQPPPADGFGGAYPGGPEAAEGYGGQQYYPEQQQQQPPAASAAPQAPPTLTDALRAYTSGAMSSEEFHDTFLAGKIYCPRGENPGFLALHNTQQPVIPLFTSLKELRRYAGKESRYFTVTGGEVLDLLPTGYGFALDMEGEHRLVLDAKSVEEMVEYTMRRLYG
ncbi:SseB protein N-terminal domain-containing protein [Streptomyces zhaozhouensis]|uniref:SseB protein N-terminal domain-containing protein n=1 Tax=Streptomyces zhaozhouensis TaxID=1300267 RepID=A0A286DX64_9ACTN|nr:SseB family protein [Streptomyces zhaozhouensis]SOD63267.1 SseB protein N-terminal domain-containing protein [Streptomyces zhaozhouensis]